MTGLELLQYAAHAISWLRLIIFVGAEQVGWTVRQATCESGGAFIAWSGGTFDQALGLVQQAAACVRPS